MGWLLPVTQTTDMGVFVRKFTTWVPMNYPGGGRTPVTSATTFEELRAALTGAVDLLSSKVHFLTTIPAYWTALGVPVFDVANMSVGTRFYVSGEHYIRVSALNYSNPENASISFQYYKGQQLCLTVSFSGEQFNTRPMLLFPWVTPWAFNTTVICSRIGVMGTPPYLYYSIGETNATSQQISAFNTWLQGVEPIDEDDPYLDITDSQPSGPAEGVGYPEDELVPIPSLPSVSVTDTGFVTLFNPTLAQVKALASYMWAGLFDVATFKKLFADPMDCILGFNMLPVSIPGGGTAEVVVGNISTGVSMTKAAGQWVELDCGSVAIDKPFGNYLDYSPYMKYSIYLPYIGTVDLSTDDIMGHTIHLVYHVDVLSCACVAYLEVDGRVMYQWTGSCGYSIPVTGENFRQMIANIVNIAANLGGAIATGGMTAPLAIASAASVTQNVMSSKPEVHRSGAIGSSAGMLGMQTPYLIQQGPKICKPQSQYHYLGYPAFVTVTLGDVSGYQEFSNVILSGIPCTEEERDMIAAACEGGIYL